MTQTLIITARDTPHKKHPPEPSQPLAIIIHGCFKPVNLEGFINTREEAMATLSSILALRIPGMGEPGGLLSVGSHRVGHD